MVSGDVSASHICDADVFNWKILGDAYMQKVCVNHHSYDASLNKCPFCSEEICVNTPQNENVSDDTMKSCANGHFYPATLEECPYCRKEIEDRAYLTHLCPGCMTYLDQPDLPCPFCGWEIKNNTNVYALPPRHIIDGKYMIGSVIETTECSILYIGWDLNRQHKALIKEYFPHYFASRCDDGYTVIPRATSGSEPWYDDIVEPLSVEKAQEVYAEGRWIFFGEGKRLFKIVGNIREIVVDEDCIRIFPDEEKSHVSDMLIFICPVECMFGVNNTAYLIMEYIEGQTIEDYVSKTGSMSFADSLKLLSPIFKAIDKLHKRNMFHLLLNPKNILLTNDGVRLIDFHDESYMHQLQLNLGETLLVREFIAPEFETNSAKMGVPIDVYNLAAILYYTITGKAPANSYEHMLGRKVEPPSALGANITSLQESALLKGLAESPTDRYQSVNHFFEALMVDTKLISDINAIPNSQDETLVTESLATYAKHLCLGCMTYLESPLIPCSVCGWTGIPDNIKSLPMLPIGSILINRYVVGRVMFHNEGCMTYIAWDNASKKKVAIKEFFLSGFGISMRRNKNGSVSSCWDENFFDKCKEKFYNKARCLTSLVHPSYVHVQDAFKTNNTIYAVLEFIDGKTLEEILNEHEKKLPLLNIIDMLSPIFDALEFVHKAGFLYENLSLGNIIFTQSGVKLMDFCDSSIDYLEKQDEDADFDLVFRPYPIPFERMSPDGKVGAWCDVYAMAFIIYRSITGEWPTPMFFRLHNECLELPSTLGIHISVAQEKALLKGLAVNPKDRYQTMREFYDALIDVQDSDKEESNIMDKIKRGISSLWR